MRVLLVDDHYLMRSGVREFLEGISGVSVIGEASSAGEALALAEETQPDVVLMDIELPDFSGIEATRRITHNKWCQQVVMFTANEKRSFVKSAFEAGARGYVAKSSPAAELLTAFEALERGKIYLSPGLSPGPKEDGREIAFDAAPPSINLLSPRELEILVHVAEGDGAREIAETLGISARTVETHRSNIMKKLRVNRLSRLVRIAIREGLVSA